VNVGAATERSQSRQGAGFEMQAHRPKTKTLETK
jgi:hypothetical protein